MKNIILLLLVALVPFLSIAQKRSNKKNTTISKQDAKIQLSDYEYMSITGIEQDPVFNEEEGEVRGAAGPEQKFMKRLKSKSRIFVRFNSGKITPEILELNKLSRECNSMMLALNAASKYGYDLHTATSLKEENTTVHIMYLRRKR